METMEADPLAFPKQELVDLFVKEETLVEIGPLVFPKKEIVDIFVKEEIPMETDPLAFTNREVEDIFVKEETPSCPASLCSNAIRRLHASSPGINLQLPNKIPITPAPGHFSYGANSVRVQQVETDPLPSFKPEIEYISVNEETPVDTDPFIFPKRESKDMVVKEETLFLHEWVVPAGLGTARDPLSIKKEECSPLEDCFGPSTFSSVKTEAEEDEEPMSSNDVEEIKHEVESTCSGSEPESTIPIGVEDNDGTDGSGDLDTEDYLTAGTAHRRKCTTKLESSIGNQRITSSVVHQSATCKNTSAHWQDVKDSCEFLHSCSVCHKTFIRSNHLKRHIRLHTCERRYRCEVCNKTFTHSGHLKRHSMLHTGERPYSCGVCNKTFTQSGNLKSHSRLHTGDSPYSCGVCNKTFTQSGNLKSHSRLHTGDRPYSCGVCNKTFTLSSSLKKHTLMHTGERPYSCGVCNKTFTHRSALKNHSLHQTLERTYCCEVCNKTFMHSGHLKNHSRLHTGERPYSCGVCNLTFARRYHLKSHSQLHTGECTTVVKVVTSHSHIGPH